MHFHWTPIIGCLLNEVRKFNYAVKIWCVATRRKSEEHTLGIGPAVFQCILYDRRRSFVSEFMWRTCIRLNSSYKGLLVRYVTPTRPPCGRVSARLWNRTCARIGFAFFKPIIYQSCPPRFHPKSHSLAGTARTVRVKRKGRPVYDRSFLAGK